MDAEAGFTSNDFRDGLEAMGVTVRVKRPGREEKQSLAQLDSAMSTFKKALFRFQRQDEADGWSDYIDQAISYVNRKPMPYGRGTLGNAPNEIEASLEQDNVVNPGDPSRLSAFEMQRQAARDYKVNKSCLLYTSPSPRDATLSRMPSSA